MIESKERTDSEGDKGKLKEKKKLRDIEKGKRVGRKILKGKLGKRNEARKGKEK